jgi:DNA-binding XRE family transcriptional regulator
MSMVVACPRCKGNKGGNGFVNRGAAGCAVEFIPCGVCRGQGMVEPHVRGWYDAGDKFRALRRQRDLSLREAAKVIGVSVVDVSEAERGIRDPEPFIQKLGAGR